VLLSLKFTGRKKYLFFEHYSVSINSGKEASRLILVYQKKSQPQPW
jgi:hypothetical protein